MAKLFQNYVYVEYSQILFLDYGDHFASRGSFKTVGEALDPEYVPDGSRMISLASSGDFTPVLNIRTNDLLDDLSQRFAAWAARSRCPCQSGGVVCLLRKDHPGNHRHGGVSWEERKTEHTLPHYVYAAVSKILYTECEGHFCDYGGFDSAESAKMYLGNKRICMGEIGPGNMRIAHSLPNHDAADLLTRFVQWQNRIPCPVHSSGTWGYDNKCLLPAGHAGEHKHGTFGWEEISRHPAIPIEKQVRFYVPEDQKVYIRHPDRPEYAVMFSNVTEGQVVSHCPAGVWLGKFVVRMSGRASIVWLTNPPGPSPEFGEFCEWYESRSHVRNSAHCMVKHPISGSPCMHPAGHGDSHCTLGGQGWYALPDEVGDRGLVTLSYPRPDPEGLCSFCAANPSSHWGSNDWNICASADCSAAHHFHEERCQSGSVDTPETRAESLRYGRQWLLDQAFEDAQKKPEGSCAFCATRAEERHPGCIVAVCSKHEREAWRLTHRIELGGVSDTPQLRAEVLRHVAASDAFLRDRQREEYGARTESDHGAVGHRYPDLTARAQDRPPPEEIPLVGTTPHYEWP